MKRLLPVLSALALIGASSVFVSCNGMIAGDENYSYATTAIGSPVVTAKAWPGVNILSWNVVNGAASYNVYRAVAGGELETLVQSISDPTMPYYPDTDLDEGTTYTYRVVAIPSDLTVHDSAQTVVKLTTAKTATGTNLAGTWAPEGTTFSELAQYESGYNPNDEVLSADTIKARLITSQGNTIRVSFPVKPYGLYLVSVGQVNGGLVGGSKAVDSMEFVVGCMYDKTATIDLTALYSGTKQVTVSAVPFNNELYGISQVASTATVDVVDFSGIDSATVYLGSQWTNYDSENHIAKARVYFAPYNYNGEEFDTSEYTIYRALYDSNGETLSGITNDDGEELHAYSSITNLGSPKKDYLPSSSGFTVYYLDDTAIDLSAAKDVAGVRYFVVLNHKGKIKSETTTLTVPDDADGNWHFEPDTTIPVSYSNSADLYDISIATDGVFSVMPRTWYSGVLSVTYGTFDTYNEAKTAVESELPNKLTTTDTDTSYPVYTGVAVDTNKYYAFRVLSTKENTADSVVTVIAKPVQNGGAYFWDVIGDNKPSAYRTVNTPSLSVSNTVGETNFNAATLEYYASNAYWYNIYRTITPTEDVPASTELIATTTETTYTDSTITSVSAVSNSVSYSVTAVGYYGYKDSSSQNAARISAPVVTVTDLTLSWSSIANATAYYIYRATSEDALASLSNSSYYATVTGTSFTTFKSDVDYYYAVKAYGLSGEYSTFSAVKTIAAGETVYSWSRTSAGTYTFTEGTDHVWSSNNQNLDNTSATAAWTITLANPVTYTIPYSVGSESGYDKLTVTLDGNTIVNRISGSNSSSYTTTLAAGEHTITATYSKDSSNSYNGDTATVTLDNLAD